MILKSKEERVKSKLEDFGFYKAQSSYILNNFRLQRIVDVVNYYGWLLKNRGDKDYTQKYFYHLLSNFDFNKTWKEYQDYYKSKKQTASLDLTQKKKYISSGKKVGKDAAIDSKPKNVLDFIKHGTESKNRK